MALDELVELSPEQYADIRLCVQRILTLHVLESNIEERDLEIAAGVDAYGVHLPRCVVAFILSHASEDVVDEVALDRFSFMVHLVSLSVELLSEQRGWSYAEALNVVVGPDAPDTLVDGSIVCEADTIATRAAQVCLMSNYVARTSGAPWGIQASLRLDEMTVVVPKLGLMLFSVIDEFAPEEWGCLAGNLMDAIELILSRIAEASGLSLRDYVGQYFAWLVMGDLSA